MSGEDERAVWDRQATFAERLAVESAPDSGDRFVVLDGTHVGKTVWLEAEDAWTVLYATPDGYTDSLNQLMAERDDTDEADRHAIGWVADALARGDVAVDGREG